MRGSADTPSHRRPTRPAFDAPPAAPSPSRELARRALDVLRRARLASPPDRWLRPGFGREVELVRLHLTPVRTRVALAGSFGREAFNRSIADAGMTGDGRSDGRARSPLAASLLPQSIGPVHVAYALRWLELGDGRRRAPFTEWLADPTERALR